MPLFRVGAQSRKQGVKDTPGLSSWNRGWTKVERWRCLLAEGFQLSDSISWFSRKAHGQICFVRAPWHNVRGAQSLWSLYRVQRVCQHLWGSSWAGRCWQSLELPVLICRVIWGNSSLLRIGIALPLTLRQAYLVNLGAFRKWLNQCSTCLRLGHTVSLRGKPRESGTIWS